MMLGQIEDTKSKFGCITEWKKDKTLGYMYALEPKHTLADRRGKVYQHVFVMATKIGRVLLKDEVVHHIDRNRANNHPENLMLLSRSEHSLLHSIEDKGGLPAVKSACERCGEIYKHPASVDSKYCSTSCSALSSRKFEVTRERLNELVWSMPTVKVAELLGVSDVAVSKRCKLLGVNKPPRGYWRKVEAGVIVTKVPTLN